MEQNLHKFDQIERYLKGQLSTPEMTAFEAKMADDPALKEAVDKFRLKLEMLEYLLESDLRKKMQSWQKSPQPVIEQKTSRRLSLWWLAAAAVLTGIAIVLYYNYPHNPLVTPPIVHKDRDKTDTSTHKLIPDSTSIPRTDKLQKDPGKLRPINALAYQNLAKASYAKPQSLEGELMGVEELSPRANNLSEAYQAYQKQDYQRIIQLLEAFPKSESSDDYNLVQELLGHAYFQKGQYQKAVQAFRILKELSKDPFTVRQTEWYLALSLVPDYPNSKAELDPLLQSIILPENEHFFASKAKQLQAKLKSIK